MRHNKYHVSAERYCPGLPLTLTNKVITAIVSVFCVYAVAEMLVQRWIVLPRFVELERVEALQDHQRAADAIRREIDHIDSLTADWALWDDTYAFMADGNEAYRSSNFVADTLSGIDMDLIVFFDTKGNVFWGEVRDPLTHEIVELETVSSLFGNPATNPLTKHDKPDGKSRIAGVRRTPFGYLLVTSRPILTSDNHGPSRGAIIMGKYLTTKRVASLANRAAVDLVALAAKPTDVPSKEVQFGGDDKNLVLTSVMQDIDGTPALRLQVTVPREITQSGIAASRYAMLMAAFSGAVILLVLILVLRKIVLKPIADLALHAKNVGQRDGIDVPIDVRSNDEIGLLATEFNDMTARLREARRQLASQSHAAGVAEMASGVLHNIGNAITPVNTHLINSVSVLKRLPLADLEAAAARLRNERDEGKREEFVKFILLAAQHAEKVSASVDESLTRATKHLGQVLNILDSQHRFSRAENIYDIVELSTLIDEGISVMRHEFKDRLDISTDRSITEFGLVRAPAIAITQVVTNLAVNAAEAVARGGRERGALNISAEVVMEDDTEIVHLRFQDDGAGLTAEDIDRIFESGYSTKLPQPSGLGLHWCANTLNSLHGSIAAESAGPGQGVTMHVKFPLQRPDFSPYMENVA